MTTLSLPAIRMIDASSTRLPWRTAAVWAIRLLAIWVCWQAGRAGLELRSYLWESSADVRFTGDIGNGWRQGSHVVRDACMLAGSGSRPETLTFTQFFRGFRERYAAVAAEAEDDRYSLDYTPARLFVMSMWAWHELSTHPDVQSYTDAAAQPLLNLNTGCEITIAVFMFLLVHHWARRERLARNHLGPKKTAGEMPWILGLIAALYVWFNPALLADGHVWPQWDCWTLPGYIAAAWLASIGWWSTGGVAIAVSAMFKGQLLMVAPVLILWPVFAGQLVYAWRAIAGFAFGIAIAASVWLVPTVDAAWWLVAVIAFCIGGVLVARRRRWRSRVAWPVWGLIPMVAITVWPLLGSKFGPAGAFLAGMVVVTPLLARWLSRVGCAVWISAITTVGIFCAAGAFGGTWWWLRVGFFYPTYHFDSVSHSCANLPQWLDARFGFHLMDPVLSTPPALRVPEDQLTFKYLMIAIYATTLVLCAIGAALHARRNSAQILVSIAAPWILMFTILGQMHERYLVWGAAAGAMVVGASLGMALLQVVVAALGTISICNVLYAHHHELAPVTTLIMTRMYPGSAWLLMMAASVYLFVAVVPIQRRWVAR